MNNDQVLAEISEWYAIMSPGIHAILLVINAERYTNEEEDIVGLFERTFGDRLKDFLIVVFANKDKLIHHNKTLLNFISTLDKSSNLFKLIERSNRRCVSVGLMTGTKENREDEAREILSKIDEIAGQDGNNYYSNEKFTQIEEMIRKEEERLCIERSGEQREIHSPNSDIRDEIRRGLFTGNKMKLLAGITLVIAGAVELVQMYIKFKQKKL